MMLTSRRYRREARSDFGEVIVFDALNGREAKIWVVAQQPHNAIDELRRSQHGIEK